MENDYLMLNSCPVLTTTSLDKEKELAILFLDIRNFTGLMELIPGQSMIQVVRRLFTAFNQIIKNFNGKVIETTGDNLYAVFGLATNLREAANDAYQAAKMMFRTMNFFNEAYAVPFYGNPIEIGVGLHSGNVYIGEFGLDTPARLSIMGLPVNIASRLQAKTKDFNNDMLISEETYILIESEGMIFDRRVVSLQGISQYQQIRLAGKPYNNPSYLSGIPSHDDYLLAISG
jgi:adenylate cyclase